ncbi:MAG: CheR family methyltransferase [Hydrogenovibrio sp.]|uniref:CheR family methyltransferase n=1 Tax=Hydrogenovibrio sp. TaxID=2065821 RepID=UPI00286FF753|nr:EAL domain-containing protein [Hydrogenovibrio sp.]MDR9498621.1 CheR family methyltransferase [Hydrogenovibrio sp.]
MYYVGIGASAGGIEALKRLLKDFSPKENATYIVAQHISPTHASMLTEILSRFTDLTVRSVENRVQPEAGTLYITPPNYHVVLEAGYLMLIDASDRPSPKPSINLLFESLAQHAGVHAIGIILSGTGSDGASGLMAIRTAGGITIAQEPATSEYNSMPLSAIESGAADLTLPIEEMPQVVRSANQLIRRDEKDPHWGPDYRQLMALVNDVANVDLTQYKRSSLKRRIDRRMAIHQIHSIGDYLQLLSDHPEEIREFVKDVFISVTDFFRDPEAFDQLTRVLEKRLSQLPQPGHFRIWVPGCASGEEAYTLAMLLEEIKRKAQTDFDYQIFATDISEKALSAARAGIYPDKIAQNIPEALLERYFEPTPHGYKVRQKLKESMLFSRHDLIKDPPFSRIDLVTCRNVLIYFNQALQEQVLMVFNFALKPNGLLFLGQSESAKKFTGLFVEQDPKARIYQKVEGLSALPIRAFNHPVNPSLHHEPVSSVPKQRSREKRQQLIEKIEHCLFTSLSPDYLVIDQQNQLIFSSENASEYLQKSTGFMSLDVLDNLKADINPGLRSLIYRFRQQDTADGREALASSGLQKTLSFKRDGQSQFIRISVMPLDFYEHQYLIILFQPLGIGYAQSEALASDSPSNGDESVIQALNDELNSTRESLQTVIEELETTNEELQASNEEMMSTNEELQSTNEEMQTSNEELQSSNEELQTINDEISIKNHQLDQANTQLKRIETAMETPILQLDAHHRVEYISEAFHKLFPKASIHEGVPVQQLSFLGINPSILNKLIDQSDQIPSIDKRELTIGQRHFELKFTPYFEQNTPNGMVIQLQDVTHLAKEKKQAESQLHIALSTLEAIGEAVIRTDANGLINLFNPVAEKITGYTAEQATGQHLQKILRIYDRHQPEQTAVFQALEVLQTQQDYHSPQALVLHTHQERRRMVELTSSPYEDQHTSGAVIVFRDVTDREQLIDENEWQATHDQLTGLYNRQFSEKLIEKCLERAAFKSDACAFLFVDLDKFKIINDTAGHAAGDAALKYAVETLSAHLRNRDQFCRLGGDEFGVILRSISLMEATQVAHKLIQSLRKAPFEWQGQTYHLSLSIGVFAVEPGTHCDLQTLLKNSDQAMYQAKKLGGDEYVVYQPDKPEFASGNAITHMIHRLQNGLDDDAFYLAEQPIVTTRPGQKSGVELLLRFKDAEGALMPGEIIPVAERYGLIKTIDLMVVEKAFARVVEQKNPDRFYTINLSSITLAYPDTGRRIIELGESVGLDFHQVVFEITESASIANFGLINAFIKQVRNKGSRIFLDDFGTGFSSFELLKNLELDGIKIDGQFIRKLGEHPFDLIVVKSIIELATEMGIETIAEFVETQQIADQLDCMGIDWQQGYHYGRPV